jgi:hypothetical protein
MSTAEHELDNSAPAWEWGAPLRCPECGAVWLHWKGSDAVGESDADPDAEHFDCEGCDHAFDVLIAPDEDMACLWVKAIVSDR